MNINSLRVYDPKNAGIDSDRFEETTRVLQYGEAISLFSDALKLRVIDSDLGNGETLRDYLYSKNGWFEQNPSVQGVMFVDGKLYRSFVEDPFPPGKGSLMDRVMAETKAVPFFFGRNDSRYTIQSDSTAESLVA